MLGSQPVNKFMDSQLYLNASICVTQANSVATSQIFDYLQSDDERAELLKLICVLWPELDDSIKLKFLWECSPPSDDNEILVTLIQELPILAAVSKIDADTVQKRHSTVKKHVDDVLRSFDVENTDFSSLEEFLRIRIILVDAHYPNSLWYLPVIEHINSQSLNKWLNGVLRPLNHLNKTRDDKLKIFDFEAMDSAEVLNLMWDLPTMDLSVVRSMMKYEVKPYLDYNGNKESFYNVIFNTQNFQLDSLENFKIFKFLLNFDALDSTSRTVAWEILFENGLNLQKIPLPNLVGEFDSIVDTLGKPEDEFDGIALSQWHINIQFMNDLGIKDLKSLKKLQDESQAVQISYFSGMIQSMFQSNLEIETLKSIINFINASSLFNKLSHESQQSVVVENLLSSGKFDILEQFLSFSDTLIEDEVLVRYFWTMFNDAAVGSSSNPNMINATRTLNLLKGKDKYVQLFTLLKVSEELSHYALTFRRGVPFKPFHLLEYKTDIFELIAKLLDLNPKLMKDVKTTFNLVQNISLALGIEPSDDGYYKEYSKLLSEHINTSLANGDFQFAFEQAAILIERQDVVEHWVTIFQVGKYLDPSWLDRETPTEIIYLQLSILSKLLHVCPEQEYEVIISQWSALELELSTRDIIRDKHSLENSQNKSEQFINDVSSSFASFLSGKFQRNIGSN